MRRWPMAFVSLFFSGVLLAAAPPPREPRLIQLLGDDDFQVRQDADADLREQRPEPVLAVLRAGLFNPDLEIRQRAVRIFHFYHDQNVRRAQAVEFEPGLAAALFARGASAQTANLRQPTMGNRLLRRWNAAVNAVRLDADTKRFRQSRKAYLMARAAVPVDNDTVKKMKLLALEDLQTATKAQARVLAGINVHILSDKNADPLDPLNGPTVHKYWVEYPKGAAGARKYALVWDLDKDSLQVIEHLHQPTLVSTTGGIFPETFRFTGGTGNQNILFAVTERTISIAPGVAEVLTLSVRAYGPDASVMDHTLASDAQWAALYVKHVPKKSLDQKAAIAAAAVWTKRLGARLQP